jgi:hypothetical protein
MTEDVYVLQHPRFSESDDEAEVWNIAKGILTRICGVAAINGLPVPDARVSSVVRENDAGGGSGSAELTARFRAISPPPVGGFTVSDLPEEQHVERALRLCAEREFTWSELYKLWEIVVDDVGQDYAIAAGWLTDQQRRRFQHTANSVGAVGDDARHGRETTQPPRDPLPLSEAKAMVKGILRSWLSEKSQRR